jgi:acetyltransferase
MAGLGGIFAETMADTALRVLPAGPVEIGAMLRELRAFPLLAGARGRPPADLAALEALLVGLARLAVAHPEIAELDVNPILAFPHGAVVADARIILAGPSAAGASGEA